MDDGQELANVIGAIEGTIVEHLFPCGQVYGLVFHGARVSAAARVHCPGIGFHLQRQWQHGIVSPLRRVFQFLLCHAYMRSGTSMPSRAMPFLMTLPTLLANTSRVIFSSWLSALRME